MNIGRRRFFGIGAGAVALTLVETSCDAFTGPDTSKTDARLTATPHTPKSPLLSPGLHVLGLGDGGRDGWVFVPDAAANGPVPLLVILHGAGASADEWDYLTGDFNGRGIAVIAPDSVKGSWDYRYGFGPDVHFIDIALQYTFDRVKVDASRVAIAGFSDGATYSLTLGMTNGDLFRKIIAWSPSGPVFLEPRGKPLIFISHGTGDQVLPVTDTRNYTVPKLTELGYDVHYEEFAGGHTVPAAMVNNAFNWWLA
jgi:phospholipase/carboxylesterase